MLKWYSWYNCNKWRTLFERQRGNVSLFLFHYTMNLSQEEIVTSFFRVETIFSESMSICSIFLCVINWFLVSSFFLLLEKAIESIFEKSMEREKATNFQTTKENLRSSMKCVRFNRGWDRIVFHCVQYIRMILKRINVFFLFITNITIIIIIFCFCLN